MASSRVPAFVAVSLVILGTVAIGSDSFGQKEPSNVDVFDETLSLDTAHIRSYLGLKPDLDSPNLQQKGVLRRIEQEGGIEGERRERQDVPPMQRILHRLWYSKPIPDELKQGINKGLFNVGVVFAIWFACMCTIGGAMRCFLCCDTLRTNPGYDLILLYDSFMDRVPDPGCEEETEGIALDSLRSSDVENHVG